MSQKTMIYIGLGVGATVGGYFPIFWGGSLFSFTSIILSAIGATIGLLIAYRLTSF